MEIKEGWVVIVIVAFIVGLIVGANVVSESFISDCAKMGKFSWHQHVYQCSPEGKKNEP